MSSKLSQCSTGKICYYSKKEAKKAMKLINNSKAFEIKMRYAYKCDACTYWHLTSLPRENKKFVKKQDHASDELKKLRESVIKTKNCK